MTANNKKKFKTRRISGIHLVGEKLKNKRTKKRISLERAEDETKIRVKYLEALESDNYDAFSSHIYALGFLRRYADFLGLSADELIKQQEQMFKNYPKKINRLTPAVIKKTSSFIITSKFIIIFFIVIAIVAIFGYIGFEIKKFSAPPILEVLSPKNNITWQSENIEIIGKTDPGATVLINNEQIMPSSSGDFKKNIKLKEGINIIQVSAKNRVDKINAREISVYYESQKKELEPSPSPGMLPSPDRLPDTQIDSPSSDISPIE